METMLNLQRLDEAGNVMPFISVEDHIEIVEFKYSSTRMGGAPTISFTLKHSLCLDNYWSEYVFAEFQGERYFLSKTPSSSYDNTDARYIHNVVLVSERAVLDTVYFYDVVSEDYEGDRPVSNSSKVTFYGNIEQFVERLNFSLQYAKLQTKNTDGTYSGYVVTIDDDILPEVLEKEVLLAFNYQFMSGVLQEIYNGFELPYYFVGKEIHIGYASDVVNSEQTSFTYGIDDALLSIKKTNSNNKIINRCTATGSSENIPYYYPNETPLGDIEVVTTGGVSARISAQDKFSSYALLNEVLTYSELKDYEMKNDVSYSHSWVDVDNTRKEATLQLGDYVMQSVPRKNKANEGFKIVLDLTKYNESGLKTINVRFKIDLEEFVAGDGVFLEKYKKDLYVTGDYYVSVDGSEQVPFVLANNTQTSYTITAGRKYEFIVYPYISINSLLQTKFKSDEEQKYGTVRAKVRVQGEVSLNGNDTYYLNYGWVDTQNKTVQLKKHGVEVVGEPKTGDTISFNLLSRVDPQTNLMPSIYRLSDGKERFYNAISGTYGDKEYTYPNPYVEGKPKEHILELSDIKPTITGMTNAAGQPIDKFLAFAYDVNDSNETEEIDGNLVFKHPYFFAKLPKLDFNLFDHAIENGEMTISMTTGNCGACNFVIGVSELSDGTLANPVQVDENGNLVYDDNGNVLCGRENYQGSAYPQDEQNDTRTHEVWIALKKEESTYGTLMPSRTLETSTISGVINETSIRPSTDDTFVITNIHLPKSYITAAEEKLKYAILDYMLENNAEKFNFGITFSRIYLQEHPEILQTLNENARIYIEYNGIPYLQYVNDFTYNVDSSALPEITIGLTDSLSVGENIIQSAVGEIGNMVANMITSMDTVTQCLPYFLRKDIEDTAYKKIIFRKGAEFGNFSTGALGSGGAISIDGNGNSIAEFDFLNVRKKAMFKELTIQELKNVGGELILSPAAMKCESVTELEDAYRCYFNNSGEAGLQIRNEFAVNDQVRCQTFNMNGNRYYWRLVVGIGENYIDVSKTDCDTNSDAPLAGDNITVLGNREDKSRQAAIVFSACGEDSPSMIQYSGIDGYSLEGCLVTKFSDDENIVTGKMTIQPNSKGAANLEDLEIGGENLLRNSIFVGDYTSPILDENSKLREDTDLTADALLYWDYTEGNVDIIDDEKGKGGKAVEVNNGYIAQTVEVTAGSGRNYVVSFEAKGEYVDIELNGQAASYALDDYYQVIIHKFNLDSEVSSIELKLFGNFTICNVKLEHGITATDWSASSLDLGEEMMETRKFDYLRNAMQQASTDIVGGLVLTNIIKVGNYDGDNLQMTQETGGMSGVHNDDDDVAFWAGGDIGNAISTVQKYRNNTNFQPTQEELAQMAKFVVTHGGRAILNDIILRGYVYAEGGVFNGTVNATDGVFNGKIEAGSLISGISYKTVTHVTPENRMQFGYYDENTGDFIIDITKTGPMFSVNFSCTIDLTQEEDDLLPLVGNTIIIQTRRGGMNNQTIPVVWVKGLFASRRFVTTYEEADNSYTTNEIITVEETTKNILGMFSAECTFITDGEGYHSIAWQVK